MDTTSHFQKAKVLGLIKQNSHFWVPLAIGVFLRVYGVANNSIWYDEALTIYLTREPLLKMVSLITTELNPPLWEILEWLIVRVFPTSETTYRLLSLFSGIGILFVAHEILTDLQVDRLKQFFTLIILAISPYQIWMSQDARVYALMSFLYLLGFWFMMKKNWLGLLACCGLLIYSNSAAIFYIATLLIAGLILVPQNRMILFGIGFGTILLFSPWLASSFLSNLSGNYFSGYNIPPVNSQRLIEQINDIFLIRQTTNPLMEEVFRLLNMLVILIFLTSIVLYWLLVKQSKQIQSAIISLLSLAVVPLILITVTAWFYKNGHLILSRSLSATAIPFILIIAVFAKIQPKLSLTLLSILLILNIGYHFIWSPQEKGGHLREVIQELSIHDEKNNVIFHATATSLLPFQYYLSNASHYLLEADLPAGFLNDSLQKAFGLQKITPQQIPSNKYWIVWAVDDHLPPFVSQVMSELVNDTPPVANIKYPQMAKIHIYYVSKSD